jgi:hypothetical protein
MEAKNQQRHFLKERKTFLVLEVFGRSCKKQKLKSGITYIFSRKDCWNSFCPLQIC